MSSIVIDKNPMFSENPASTNAPAMPEQSQAPHAAAVAEQNSAEPPIVPFKERVIGVAKKTRGTVLGKPELKEHGEKILQGEASIHDINEPRST